MLIELSDDPDLEALMELVAEAATMSPTIRAELQELANLARRKLVELEELGLIRVVRNQDGVPVAAELLRRTVQ